MSNTCNKRESHHMGRWLAGYCMMRGNMYIRSGDDYCTDINHRIRRVQRHDDSPFQAHFSRYTQHTRQVWT
jgi:hypothetical protein